MYPRRYTLLRARLLGAAAGDHHVHARVGLRRRPDEGGAAGMIQTRRLNAEAARADFPILGRRINGKPLVDQWLAVDTPTQDRKVGPRGFGVQPASLDHAGCPSFIRSATETDSSVDVMVPCSCSQKACAEQGVSAWVHSPGPPPSARQLTGASDPSRLRTMSAIEIASGRRASAYPPLTPIRLVINPARRSWPAICSR